MKNIGQWLKSNFIYTIEEVWSLFLPFIEGGVSQILNLETDTNLIVCVVLVEYIYEYWKYLNIQNHQIFEYL